jgi:uncharacterized protein YjbJ (UPF0337 family)
MFQCHFKYLGSGNMHKDRFAGVTREAKGAIKEAVGKRQNAVGGAKELIKNV